MTDLLLALIPDYGLYLVAGIVFLAAIGIPMPSSIIALTSGGLASTGDFNLAELLLSIFSAYAIGDQVAYSLGNSVKPERLERMRSSKFLGSFVQRSETFYDKHGLLAIFLSRTVISSIGPYIAYFSGIKQTKRIQFSAIALAGAALWTITYVMLGYTFAGNVPQISNLVASFIMTGLAAVVVLIFATRLIFAWRRFETA